MLQRIKCLLVDDLEETLLTLAAPLQRDDVELLTARSGKEALELLLRHDVALALLGAQIPDMDRFELAERIRGNERSRHVPLVFVTSGAHERQLKQQLTEELRNRAEDLRSNEMFSALLAHALRNPLSAMLASARLLQRRSSDAHAHEAAARIISSGNRMGRLIEDMQDLARARLAGGLMLQREPGDFRVLVEGAIREHQSAAQDRRIDSICAGEFSGSWDAARITQLVSHLIGNALKHGDPQTSVAVHLDGTETDSVRLSVVNSGTIPDELRNHLFDPFRGGQRPSGRSEGLGLGLYIVSQIVKGHRGSIDVESGNGQTTVRVVLPRDACQKSPA